METMRKPFQGVFNIIRFNRHFYAVSLGVLTAIFLLTFYFQPYFAFYIYLAAILALVSILITLVVSFYVYDLSNLYQLDWLDDILPKNVEKIVNINAGFDETSVLLEEKFENAEIIVLDFYDASKHTEISIERARRAYPLNKNALKISTSEISLKDESANAIFLILSAHEIRNDKERTEFFKESARILRPNGKIILTEHLRDLPNFLAYNVGALHFHSEKTWLKNARDANLKLARKISITPFIKTFVFEKNGNSS